jgi:hypothetical protein
MNTEEFKENLKVYDSIYVYRKFLLGHRIWYFFQTFGEKSYAEKYDEFKLYMSNHLNLHVNNIAIVGSAKLGFSLSPKKKYSEFNLESDIDIVIVSSEIFRNSWDAFIDLSNRYYLKEYKCITSNIFRRFISLKNPDLRNDFFQSWAKKIDPCKKDLQTRFGMPHDINYRVYDSWEDVERYHVLGLECLKAELEK